MKIHMGLEKCLEIVKSFSCHWEFCNFKFVSIALSFFSMIFFKVCDTFVSCCITGHLILRYFATCQFISAFPQ